MLNGKGKEIYVGKLPWAMDSVRINNVGVQQTDCIRPEFVDIVLASIGKTFQDRLDRQCVRIAGVRHYADTPVLGYWTGSPAFSCVLREPTHGDRVRRVIGVEQCDQHVNVQKRAHYLEPFEFEQPAVRIAPRRGRRSAGRGASRGLIGIVLAKLID
jgi:hypothetical protein